MLKSSLIKELAQKHGFDICGVTPATILHENRKYFNSWLSNGYGKPLEYLTRYQEIRFDPSQLIDGSKSVIVCGVSYKNSYSLGYSDAQTPRIASYALNRDYHKTLRKRAKNLLRDLHHQYPNIQGRYFSDSAPLLEKQLAVNAGLGWIGRQSLLINPQFGSFILLAEIVIDHPVDSYDSPLNNSGCGECRKCISTCPTSAINGNRTIDTRLCISCRTVEVDDSSPETLYGWIFGCDECQSCCPHNQRTPLHINSDFDPIITPPSREEWSTMTEVEFTDKFGQTPLKRAGLTRIKRYLR